MRKNHVLTLMLLVSCISLGFLNSCKKESGKNPEMRSPVLVGEQDSTMYGTCYAAAMHSFTLLTANGSLVAEEVVRPANEQFGFLFESHGLQHLVDVRGRQFGLCIHCHHASCGRNGRNYQFFHLRC